MFLLMPLACTPTDEPRPSVVPEAEATTVCYSLEKNEDDATTELWRIDLATAEHDVLSTFEPGFEPWGSHGLQRVGDRFMGFDYYSDLHIFDLSSGIQETDERDLDYSVMVSHAGEDLRVVRTEGIDQWLCSYAGPEDLLAGTDQGCVVLELLFGTRFTLHEGLLYSTWHSTNEFTTSDAVTGENLGTTDLENWDTWVWGLSVADGKLHVVDDGRNSGEYNILIGLFDLEGGRIDTVGVRNAHWGSEHLGGLWCREEDPQLDSAP